MMKRSVSSGFTLVELLVGMALTGVIMAALFSFFMQGSRVSTQTSSRSEMQQEVLGAQQLIAGRLREAWFVFPSDTPLSLGSGNLRRNPVASTSTGNWTVGKQPILAMILPPRVVGATCAIPTGGTAPTATGEENETAAYTPPTGGGNDGCYRFFAYYPVKRSQWTSSVLTTGASHPGVDESNGDTWVLVEYRDHYYPETTGGAAPVPSTTSPAPPAIAPTNRSRVYLLSDYIAPTVVTTGLTTSASPDNRYTMFTYTQETGQPVKAVTMNLASIRKSRGAVLRLPDATKTYSTTVLLTNQGKVAAD